MSINYNNNYTYKDKDKPNYGILRNVMINVKEIQKAFGIEGIDDYSVSFPMFGIDVVNPPPDIKSAMKNLCKSFSANYHDYWKFEISEDQFNKNIKVIETDSLSTLKSKSYTKFENFPSNKVSKSGIYKFPSFKKVVL